jgi:hypothetical protein
VTIAGTAKEKVPPFGGTFFKSIRSVPLAVLIGSLSLTIGILSLTAWVLLLLARPLAAALLLLTRLLARILVLLTRVLVHLVHRGISVV